MATFFFSGLCLMAVVYVDESGDLGWTFTAPYRKGGSSRYLTIAALLIAKDCKKYPKRLIKSLYARTQSSPSDEIKWVALDSTQRRWLAEQFKALKTRMGSNLRLLTVTVRKENVQQHIRADGNKLYNYMTKLLLAEIMAQYESVALLPDRRTVKVESGRSLHDYLQTALWFELGAKTTLETTPMDSKNCLSLQFADFLAGMVQNYFEDGKSECVEILGTSVEVKRLFF